MKEGAGLRPLPKLSYAYFLPFPAGEDAAANGSPISQSAGPRPNQQGRHAHAWPDDYDARQQRKRAEQYVDTLQRDERCSAASQVLLFQGEVLLRSPGRPKSNPIRHERLARRDRGSAF